MAQEDRSGCKDFIIGFMLMPLTVTLRGWAFSTLWGWFMVPLGVPGIGILHAAGIAGTIGMLTFSLADQEASQDLTSSDGLPRWLSNFIMSTSLSLVSVAFGFIYHGLM